MTDSDTSNSNKGWLEKLFKTISNEPQNRQQLIELLRHLQTERLINSDALFMLEGVLQVSEMKVRDIMIPRNQMTILNYKDSLPEIMQKITESGHSRFPVIDDDRDDIIGVLLAKDLLQFCPKSEREFDYDDYIRSATFIPESKRLNDLLKEFRRNRNHMAMVLDEYGGVAGLITIEDVLEQIVGDIDDEHDDDEEVDIREHGLGRYSVRALTPLTDFNQYFGLNLQSENSETIGGFVASKMGSVPKRGEVFVMEQISFKVLSADARKAQLFQVILSDVVESSG
ncbi:MAG: CBS domain-containing protein [Gammaproteobacteria bacterium]|nr:CBS domain-containing protein [Gammaproteobacteria bacterium]